MRSLRAGAAGDGGGEGVHFTKMRENQWGCDWEVGFENTCSSPTGRE